MRRQKITTMHPLSKIENLTFRVGALLMVAGAALFIFSDRLACILFCIGVLLFVSMQLRSRYDGSNFVVDRLRRQQLFGAFLLVLSAVALVYQTISHRHMFQHNEWVVLLLIAAIVQLYTAIRIPQALRSWTLVMLMGLGVSSCADHYQVEGSTTVHGMEGKKLYLKIYADNDLQSIDSCSVMHGKFSFRGNMDTTVMANLFLGDQSLMPIVLEGGQVALKIDEVAQSVSGTPLNDSLYSFIRRKTQLDNQLAELPRKEGRLVMDGMEHDEVVIRLRQEAQRLSFESDQLVSSFIRHNYTNVLGPGVFMIMTSELAYPVLTPQIEELLVGAPSYFLNHPYVKEYLRVANENMEKLQQQ